MGHPIHGHGAWRSVPCGNDERSRRTPRGLQPARRRAAPGDPAAEAPVAPGRGGGVEPGVQGLGARCLRAGERAISVPRLQRLARFYDVPVDQLLPDDGGQQRSRAVLEKGGKVAIDLARLARMSGQQFALLARYLRLIQVQRQDFNGRVLTVRNDDLRAIACILGIELDDAANTLDELGLRYQVADRAPQPERRAGFGASTSTSRSARALRLLRLRHLDRRALSSPTAASHRDRDGGRRRPAAHRLRLVLRRRHAVARRRRPSLDGRARRGRRSGAVGRGDRRVQPDTVTARAARAPTATAASTASASACSRWCRTCSPRSAAPTTGPTCAAPSSSCREAGFSVVQPRPHLRRRGRVARRLGGRRSTRRSRSSRPTSAPTP